MEYNFREIEKKWQQRWVDNKTYKVVEDESKKKFYVLNMFPYPSGAGLHVGHPLGYIASDIYARYKRLQGFNVLNPMGYDAYGLPAEQYAIQTGQHPAVTTEANINRYREQLDKIGFCFDWDREVRTCEPGYYHWTQWAFQQMFNHFYCNTCNCVYFVLFSSRICGNRKDHSRQSISSNSIHHFNCFFYCRLYNLAIYFLVNNRSVDAYGSLFWIYHRGNKNCSYYAINQK